MYLHYLCDCYFDSLHWIMKFIRADTSRANLWIMFSAMFTLNAARECSRIVVLCNLPQLEMSIQEIDFLNLLVCELQILLKLV